MPLDPVNSPSCLDLNLQPNPSGNAVKFDHDFYGLFVAFIKQLFCILDFDKIDCTNCNAAVKQFVAVLMKIFARLRCIPKNANESVVWNLVKWGGFKIFLEFKEAVRTAVDRRSALQGIGEKFFGMLGLLHRNSYDLDVGIDPLPLCRSGLVRSQSAGIQNCKARQNGLRPRGCISIRPVNHFYSSSFDQEIILAHRAQWGAI